MARRTSLPIRLRIWGDHACFTRPEFKGERVSYDVMTPSAARAVYEAIYWKPQIRWHVQRIDVLNPIRTMSVRRNEVKSKAAYGEAVAALKGKEPKRGIGLDVAEDRTQRTSLILKDVAYLVHAAISLASPEQPDDELTKHIQMFYRRAGRGQSFAQPYLGCREFAASFEFVPDGTEGRFVPIQEDRDLGNMLNDTFDGSGQFRPTCFHAKMVKGTIVVPPRGEVAP